MCGLISLEKQGMCYKSLEFGLFCWQKQVNMLEVNFLLPALPTSPESWSRELAKVLFVSSLSCYVEL